MGTRFLFLLENAATKKRYHENGSFSFAIFRPTFRFSSVSIMVEIQLLALALLLGTSYVYIYLPICFSY